MNFIVQVPQDISERLGNGFRYTDFVELMDRMIPGITYYDDKRGYDKENIEMLVNDLHEMILESHPKAILRLFILEKVGEGCRMLYDIEGQLKGFYFKEDKLKRIFLDKISNHLSRLFTKETFSYTIHNNTLRSAKSYTSEDAVLAAVREHLRKGENILIHK